MPTPVPEHVTAAVYVFCRRAEVPRDALDPVGPFLSKARWIPRLISPFISVDVIYSMIPSDQPAEQADIELCDKIMQLHPDFRAFMRGLSQDDETEGFNRFLSMMGTAMRAARAEDSNLLKKYIVGYLPLDMAKESVMPPIVGKDKSDRGWNHKWTARALCPLSKLEMFDENPALFMKLVREGKDGYKMKANDLPSFLYPHGTMYDEENLDCDLFRGHVLIRGLRLIYTGDSSVLTGHRAASKPSKAEKYSMREVTPESVAYIATQIYFSLCCLESWGPKDGYFNLERFYSVCLKLFTADPGDEWVKETLSFLTRSLPALKRKTKRKGLPGTGSDSEEDPDGDSTGILGQRAARRLAAVELEENTNSLPRSESALPQAPPSNSVTESETDSETDRLPPALSPKLPARSPPPPTNNPQAAPLTSVPPSPLVTHTITPVKFIQFVRRPALAHQTTRRRISMSPINPFPSTSNRHNGPGYEEQENPPDGDDEDDLPAVQVAGKRGQGGIPGGRGRGTSKRRKY